MYLYPKHTYFNGLTVTSGWNLRIATTNTLEGRFAAGSLVGLDAEALRGCDVKPVTPVYAWDNEIQVAQMGKLKVERCLDYEESFDLPGDNDNKQWCISKKFPEWWQNDSHLCGLSGW